MIRCRCRGGASGVEGGGRTSTVKPPTQRPSAEPQPPPPPSIENSRISANLPTPKAQEPSQRSLQPAEPFPNVKRWFQGYKLARVPEQVTAAATSGPSSGCGHASRAPGCESERPKIKGRSQERDTRFSVNDTAALAALRQTNTHTTANVVGADQDARIMHKGGGAHNEGRSDGHGI